MIIATIRDLYYKNFQYMQRKRNTWLIKKLVPYNTITESHSDSVRIAVRLLEYHN